jgi:hypothetical protein
LFLSFPEHRSHFQCANAKDEEENKEQIEKKIVPVSIGFVEIKKQEPQNSQRIKQQETDFYPSRPASEFFDLCFLQVGIHHIIHEFV